MAPKRGRPSKQDLDLLDQEAETEGLERYSLPKSLGTFISLYYASERERRGLERTGRLECVGMRVDDFGVGFSY